MKAKTIKQEEVFKEERMIVMVQRTQFNKTEKDEFSNEYEEEFEDCENEQRQDGGYYNNKQLFFRSQAEFYRPSESDIEQNYNATHYGGSSFKNQWNPDNAQKKQRISFRRTTNEGFENRYDENQEQEQQQPKMYNLFKKNTYQAATSSEDISYQLSLPSKRIAPNGDIPIEVHVQENDSEYVYQETSQRKKVFLKKKTIDTSDGHKIIIRHNKSAAGPKRMLKQQSENVLATQQINEEQPYKQSQDVVVKPIELQDDVVERVVVPFKTGLDNEFINLFASQPVL